MAVKKMLELFINIQLINTTAQVKYIVLQPDNADEVKDTYKQFKYRNVIMI
jgi:hypothetical protein